MLEEFIAKNPHLCTTVDLDVFKSLREQTEAADILETSREQIEAADIDID